MIDESIVKVTVTIEKRDDGGLYVYSDDMPGFVLSHRNAQLAFSDIEPALSVFLSNKLDRTIAVRPLVGLRDALEKNGFIDPMPNAAVTKRDYAAIAA
jgi:hypothetical protein